MKHCATCKAKYEDSVSFCPVDGEVLEEDPSSLVGTVLDGQYQIESLLGKGGMGAVFGARHILLGDRVAIKVLPPEVRTNAEWLRRFRREGQAARRFRHPNAVTVYDLRTSGDGTIYMVLEYIEGHTLSEEIRQRGAISPADAFATLEPILSVLDTAHAMGVVHRDLKPENIMVGKGSTGEPVVKLLDLGIAKLREIAGGDGGGNTALTMAGQVLGTPYYMSPEQWGELPRDGDPEIDGRADIYSLGLVFYELLIGKRPFASGTLHELRREHVSVVLPPLHETVSGVSPAFSQTIARATAKDRGDRQATAGEFAAELRSALSGTFDPNVTRTFPDIPRVGSSKASTSNVSTPFPTRSDTEAPTIITVDSPPLSQKPEPARVSGVTATPAEAEPPQVLSQPDAGSSAVAPGTDMASSMTIPGMAEPQVVAPPSRRGTMIIAGVGLVVLILAVVGVGGFFAVNWLSTNNNAETAKNGNNASNGSASAESRDLGRYWLELLPETLIGEPVKVAGVVPLASGQSFKFHFVFDEDGYLYIVGPGDKNQPTAFLTAKPPAISGLDSNRVTKNADFSFPSGLEHWLKLDTKPGTEDYSIIFSPTPLSTPALLSAQATGSPLSRDEQDELNAFIDRYKNSGASTENNDKNPADPFVRVKVPKSASGNPIVFEIRIQHK